MYTSIKKHLEQELQAIKAQGLYKEERIIVSSQGPEITLDTGQKVLNFCANNYLGLANHPEVIQAAKDSMDTHGFGMASVRFICGTQDIHKQLEQKIAHFYQTEDTILYAAAFDANGGVFEPLLSAEDAIISDSLNHASIIDGVRLCKAKRFRYKNNNMADLETQLQDANSSGARFKIIVTDKVQVLKNYSIYYMKSLIIGTLEDKNVLGRVDIITGTLGKALGGGMGGYTTGKKEIISMLRQRSRPYLFSNSLAPALVGASIKVFDLLSNDTSLRDRLEYNTNYFKEGIRNLGFDIIEGDSAIVPVMLYDAKLAQKMASLLLEQGIYVIGFFFPVVPREKARIRVQLSAAHEKPHLDKAIAAFKRVGKTLNIIS